MNPMPQSQSPRHVIVVGGGAAGFFGAISCAQTHPALQVRLLEAGRDCLSKVRISGGGRCNVTHACFDPAHLIHYYPRGGKALRGAFSRFQPRDTVQWFNRAGVPLKTEADGRMFPLTDDSSTIIHCLVQQAAKAGVEIQTRQMITGIESQASGFRVTLKSSATLSCDRLLLATGSHPQGYRLAKSLGHSIEPPVPSLFTFHLKDPDLRQLAGISVATAKIQLRAQNTKLEQTGPLLITHWGISGPAVLKLSAWGARILYDCGYHASIRINWLPQLDVATLRQQLFNYKHQYPKRQVVSRSPFPLPQRLWRYSCDHSAIAINCRWSDMSKNALHRILQFLSQSEFTLMGKGAFKDEFVTCGGVRLNTVNFRTMESRICPGLYFAGEILDVDGVTGGFNFQNAWTTGWLAGQAMGLDNST